MKDPFESQFEEMQKSVFKVAKRGIWAVVIIGLLNILLAVGIIGGIIYFVFWCLKHFGVIGG